MGEEWAKLALFWNFKTKIKRGFPLFAVWLSRFFKCGCLGVEGHCFSFNTARITDGVKKMAVFRKTFFQSMSLF